MTTPARDVAALAVAVALALVWIGVVSLFVGLIVQAVLG